MLHLHPHDAVANLPDLIRSSTAPATEAALLVELLMPLQRYFKEGQGHGSSPELGEAELTTYTPGGLTDPALWV